MLMIKTIIKPSPIQGLGLFAVEDIPKGTITWKYDDKLSFITYSESEWNALESNLSPESLNQIKKYAYRRKTDNQIWLNLDDTRFTNHSLTPNIFTDEHDNDFALRDIKAGEELLIDYTSFFESQWLEEVMKLG